ACGPLHHNVAEVALRLAAQVVVGHVDCRMTLIVAVDVVDPQAIDGDAANLGAGIVHAAVERLGAGIGQVQVLEHLVVERRTIDAVRDVVNADVLHQHGRAVRTESVMAIPDLEVTDHMQMRVSGPVQSIARIVFSILSSRMTSSGWLLPLAATTIPYKP